MAIRVTVGDTQVVSSVVRPQTIVKSVTVGTPIGSINIPGTTFTGLFDVNVDSDLQNNQFVYYSLADSAWRNVDLYAYIDSGDNALQLQINGNDSDILSLIGADSDLQAQINAFTAGSDSDEERIDQLFIRMDSAEADIVTLSLQIAGNDSDILSLQTRVTTLETRLDSAENELGDRITNNDSDILQLQNEMDSNELLFKTRDNSLQAQIDSNEAFFKSIINMDSDVRVAADSILQAQIDINTGRLDSEHAWNVTEHAALQTQIDSNEAFFKARINSDSDARVASDVALQVQIDSNEALFKGLINADSDARVAADSNLQAQIDSNEAFFKARINSDSDARVAADSNLNARLDSEHAWNVTEHAALQTQIDSNEFFFKIRINEDSDLRVAADSNLQAQIDSNEALHKSIDAGLQAQIDSNETLSKATDASLQAQIDSNEAFFKGIINTDSDARVAADSNLQAQIDVNSGRLDSEHVWNVTDHAALQTQIDSNALEIANEVNARISNVTNLQGQIDSNEAFFKGRINGDSDARVAADAALRASIDSNETYFKTEIATEEAARISGDGTLQSQIDSNETLSKATDTALQIQITNNDSDILALQSQPVGTDSAAIIDIIDERIDSNDFRTEPEILALIDGRIDSNDFRTEPEIITLIDNRIDSNDFRTEAEIISLIDGRIDSDQFVDLSSTQNAILGEKTFANDAGFGQSDLNPEAPIHIRQGGYSRGWSVTSGMGLLMEDNDFVQMVMATDGSGEAAILFADSADVDIGAIFYNHASNQLIFRANNNSEMYWDGSSLNINTPPGASRGVVRTLGGVYDWASNGGGGYAGFQTALSSGGATFRAHSGASGTSTFVDFDAIDIDSGDFDARFFRGTNTTGLRTFTVFRGDGTGTWDHRFRTDNGSNPPRAWFAAQDGGQVMIGSQNTPTATLEIRPPANVVDQTAFRILGDQGSIQSSFYIYTPDSDVGTSPYKFDFNSTGGVRFDNAGTLNVAFRAGETLFSNDVLIDNTVNMGINEVPAHDLEIRNGDFGVINWSGGGDIAYITTHVNNDNDAHLAFRKARGGVETPAALVSGDDLGRISFQGYNGSSWNEAAAIRVDTQSAASPYAAEMRFLIGTSDLMRIDSGGVGIGLSAPDPQRILHVQSSAEVVARIQSTSSTSARLSLMDANTTNDTSATIAAQGNRIVIQTGSLGTDQFYIDSDAYARFRNGVALGLPTGSTSSRPDSATTGDIRFNTTDSTPEVYQSNKWQSLYSVFGLFSAYDSIGTTNITSPTTVEISKVDIIDSSYYVFASNQVTMRKTGIYEISFTVTTDYSGIGTRNEASGYMESRADSIGSYSEISGTRVYTYNRSTGESTTGSMTFIKSLSAENQLRLMVTTSDEVDTVAGASRITIKKLR